MLCYLARYTPGNNHLFIISTAQPFGIPVNISNKLGNSLESEITAS